MEKTQTAEAEANVNAAADPVYPAAQLVEAYKTFGTTRAIVECALKLSGKENFPLGEAKKIVNDFKNKR